MRRLGEMVLRHRLLIVVAWVLIAVAGGAVASTVTNRMTVNFSLPGQPGDTAANKIIAAFHNGGNTTPLLATVTLPQGQTITGHEAEVAKAFASVGSADVPLRVVDEANTGDKAFRTSDDRTAYAMVFYPFPQSFTDVVPTKVVKEAVQGAAPSGAVVGVTGMDALAVGDDSGGNGVLTETLLGALGALAVLLFVFASLLAFLPLVVAAVSILTTFLLLLPLTYLTDVSFIVAVPGRAGRPGRRDRLLPALRHPMARGTRPRPRQPRRRGRGDGDGRPRRAVQRAHGRDRPARPGRAAGAVHAQHRHGRRADPARQRAGDADADAGDPRQHRAAGRLAEDPPREQAEQGLDLAGHG